MASLIYDSYFDDITKGNINVAVDTFHVLLLTSAYTPSKLHARRSDLTNEVVGAGYAAGGAAVTVSATEDTVNNREDVTLGGNTWNPATITARYAAYVKWRGGAAAADELLAVIDLGQDYASTNGPWQIAASTLRIAN